MPLTIHTSNRIENLVDALAAILKQPLPSPFTPEVIVMQSKGMQRWLAMELARRFGVWANCSYPFPNALIAELFKKILPDSSVSDVFNPDVMTWKLFGSLPEIIAAEPFSQLRHYLHDDQEGIKLYQLAQKIADTFDQYTIYRPEMLSRWKENGPAEDDEQWQAELWRLLSAGVAGCHRGELKEAFCALVASGSCPQTLLPERISVFGVSYLPAYHLQVIAAIAQLTEVNLFVLSPTQEYWADIVSSRTRSRLSPEESLVSTEGNPLLASLGKLGRDFSAMTTELTSYTADQADLYADPGADCLLHCLQHDILNLAGAEELEQKRIIAADDNSVQIHSCHSPMREIEVLYDQLLALLDHDESLTPRDILVMTPDIETYTPYISAVFAESRDQGVRIPFSIADRRLASEGEVASALMSLLALPGSRMTVVQLLDILSISPVYCCFGFEEDDLPTIRVWLEKVRVRWGLDQQDRSRLGLPEYRANSWGEGLDRLLLGYAMSDDGESLFHGMLPFDDIEGSSSQLLGKLIDFVKRTGQVASTLDRPRPLMEWAEEIRQILSGFIISNDETSRELSAITTIIADLATLQHKSEFSGAVSFQVVRSWLNARLEEEQKGLGFLTGGVTFCSMLPMRSIPFQVIAMIGMDDGLFPRQNTVHGFDLVAKKPKAGDRSLRDEDRYLFLETILSTRRYLYLSYIGQSIRDNSEIPPSVLVSELLDAVQRGFEVATAGMPVEQRLVTRHRLQAFSRSYFSEESPLFSYSQENCAALIEMYAGAETQTVFMPDPLELTGEEWRDVSLHNFLRFMVNPARFFLENRLGVRFSNSAKPLEEREPFGIDHLDAYQLRQSFVDLTLHGEDPELLLPRVRSQGILPPARHGDLLFEKQLSRSKEFTQKVQDEIGDRQPLPPLDIDLTVHGFRLQGRLTDIWPHRMYRFRCSKQKAKDLVRLWIEQLVLNAADADRYPATSRLVMADRTISFKPVEDPLAMLGQLLELYQLGLTKPLPFFPESSYAYIAGKPPCDPANARKKWEDGFNATGEKQDPYFRVCFGKADPFDAEFDRVARCVLEPLLQHRDR